MPDRNPEPHHRARLMRRAERDRHHPEHRPDAERRLRDDRRDEEVRAARPVALARAPGVPGGKRSTTSSFRAVVLDGVLMPF